MRHDQPYPGKAAWAELESEYEEFANQVEENA